jgi:ABC-type polysaccharide/polyol phosphate export permease
MTIEDMTTPGRLLAASYADFAHGLAAWRLWSKFAWHDMVVRYRRSWVGPLWIFLTAAVFIAALSLVYGTLFQIKIADYVPFVAIGVVAWGFATAVTIESVNTFVEAESYIRNLRVNLFVYVLRVVWRNIIVFAQQFVVTIVVLAIFAQFYPRTLPLAGIGLLLFLLQALWIVPLLAVLGTRFRDLPPIIGSSLQVLFFVTPVVWPPSLLGARRWIADFNPLTSLIAVVREPLLGRVPNATNYAVVVAITVVGFALAIMIYGRFRNRIVYWL